MAFIGPRNDNFELAGDLSDVASLVSIRDEIGIKEANVYLWTRRKGFEDQWEQFLPTPEISHLDHISELSEGGMILEGNIMLREIPCRTRPEQVGFWEEEQLQTASAEEGVKRYWVLAGPSLKPKAYTTQRIIKTSPIAFDVQIKRFDSINSKDIIIPGEEDMGLNQNQVDERIVALVAKGALKLAQPADKDSFHFSKSYALMFPNEGDYIAFDRSSDGLTLSAVIRLLTSPAGTVPNVLSPDQNGGPWGIRFDDSEFSTDRLERVVSEPSSSFPYDSGSHEYEKSLVVNTTGTTALFEYVQRRETDQDRNGRFFVTWPQGSRGPAGLTKNIEFLRVKVGSNPSVDIPLVRDTSVQNAYALKSDRLAEDPRGLEGTQAVNMTLNFVFEDGTLAFGDDGEVSAEVLRQADLKYAWDTLSGPDNENLEKVTSVEKYHHDFQTNQGFDIEMNNFNFVTALEGPGSVQAQPNRMASVNACELRMVLKRHDKNQWLPGNYRVKVHRQQTGHQPYLHDYQYKKGITT